MRVGVPTFRIPRLVILRKYLYFYLISCPFPETYPIDSRYWWCDGTTGERIFTSLHQTGTSFTFVVNEFTESYDRSSWGYKSRPFVGTGNAGELVEVQGESSNIRGSFPFSVWTPPLSWPHYRRTVESDLDL